MAILHRPAPLIADEATSALDALTQSEILRLFARLNRELSMAILHISHDLLSIASLCGRMAILHEGEIVEFRPGGPHLPSPRPRLHAPTDRCHPRFAAVRPAARLCLSGYSIARLSRSQRTSS